ncbi:protein-methionine sulfoxide oxidase mical3b isoform X3 [Oreochromis aureus]|uniref:protein-methionine sulfoxide oxidase mical3b isoform X3 n=1 Tax=Oreochromis aureus TaxID=47969 RepID=UPI001953A891|nr:protein-methionine sulfoxide oxidase mical3b isoform X3 [Oreochromis aureus]
MEDQSFPECQAQELFDEFVSASTCRAAMRSFSQLCEHLQLDPSTAERPLYRPIKRRLNYWRANGLWAKLDRRGAQEEYQRARACSDVTCVIIGAGPCGLRTAVELSFMGARVVLLEKRDTFSRNNVLHLWPFTIHDLRGLGAKKFYGRFCAGSIDHISIRQLQLVLLKVALLLGVEVHVNVEFKKLVEPAEDQHRHKLGWRMEVSPKNHPVSQLEFDVIIGADGRRNTLPGFRRKEFRGKLAIAITANFKNRNTTAEAKVEEISGVAFIFNQRFFQELRQETGIDLENIVYYKDDTHYFVMTAKKQSLLEKGVILQDFADTELLLSRGNVDQNALQAYAREAADFSTNHQLPTLDFAMNHYGQPDVAMFDFTCMYASENAAMVRQRHGHQLLVTLVGDSLLEPFWPMGTGVARGFLAALDSAWMIRSWAQGAAPLDVLAERESLYRLLPQTTPENMQKNITLYSVDPTTRYMNTSPLTVTPAQVRHLVDTGEEAGLTTDCSDIIRLPSPRYIRQESFSQSNQLLTWCQEQTCGYHGVNVTDLTTSWRSGLALCALIHRHRPDLIDFDSLDKSSVEENTRLGFDVAEREFGISPLMTVEEMSSVEEPDSLSMVMYLSQFYQLLKDSPPPAGCLRHITDLRSALIAPASLLSRLGTSLSRKRNPKEHREALGKRRKTSQQRREQQESCDLNGDVESQSFEEEFVGGASRSRVRLMANQLQAKLDESSSTCRTSSSPASADFRRQQGELSSLPPASEPADIQPTAAPVHSSSWRPKKRTLQQEQMSFRFKQKLKAQAVLDGDEQVPEQVPEQVSSSCSHICFFCKQRVYVMERLSAEGLFFHRSCFQCGSCSSPLRLASYTYDQHAGRFYCLQRSECHLSAPAVRKRPTPSDRAASHRTSIGSQSSAPSLSDSLISAGRRPSSAASLLAVTPERIELEIWRRSSEAELQEELEEVSEEVLNLFNLSTDNQTGSRSRSSESDMEEEAEGGGCVTSDETRSSSRETLQLYLRVQEEEEEEEGSDMESSDEVELPPHSSDTPVQPDSTSSMNSSVTPPPVATTASTASFITTPDSPHSEDGARAPLTPAVVMETPAASGRDSFDNITPELPQNRPLLLQEKGEGSEEDPGTFRRRRRTRRREAHSLPPRLLFPPLQPGGRALLFKMLREAPPPGQMELGGVGARNLLKTVFSGNKNEEKKKGGRTLPAERVKEKTASHRFTDVRAEVSDLDSSTVLQRCSLKPQNNLRLELLDLTNEIQRVAIEEEENQEPPYVPHAVAFKRSYAIKRRPLRDRVPLQDSDGQSSCPTEVVGVLVQPKEASSLSVKETMFQRECEDNDDDLDTRITRRVQRAARRQAKQEELKRLHKAQMIQRQLQQVEEKQRQLEERGVMVEKALRGEADYWGESSQSADMELHLGGLGKLDNPPLMQQWFLLVQQKNALVRYEAELMIFARELELEDRQSRLQQELRERMAVDDHLKDEEQLAEERLILEEMLEVVEQRDSLVSLLEEQRLQERQEDRDLEQLMVSGGLGLTWT